ncbi:ABC transporter permease [Bradyrhizobium erythrophlei]|uniref:ABC transporter permease n=1 Tax=Bradyrhizobium erythrophlei TaxID=1437360 RepID=UPI0035E7EE4C
MMYLLVIGRAMKLDLTFRHFRTNIRRQPVVLLLPVAFLITEILVFSIANDRFLSAPNVLNIMRQSAVLLLVASGLSFAILIGSVDLSVGAIVTLSAIAVALLVRDVNAGLWAFAAAAAIGLAAGATNACFHLFGRIPSFLATLGTMGIFTGISNILGGGFNIHFDEPVVKWMAAGRLIDPIPNVALWSLILFGVVSFVGARTHFGRYVVAVGGGETVARLSGVRVGVVKAGAFLMSGLMAGIAGFLLVARAGSATQRMGDSFMLEALASVVIGGTALSGGIGGVHRSIMGVLVIGVMSNGLNVVGVHPFIQTIIKGAVIILAVALTLDRSKSEFVK